MVRRRALAVLGLALAGCVWSGGERPRTLPADRAAALAYVALGDSTVAGVGASGPGTTYVGHLHARLRTVYPNARLANLGVSGARSADVLQQQLDRALALRPHLVTLSIGPNDITGQVRVEDYEANLERIFKRLAAESEAVVLVNLLPDLAVTPRFRGHRQEAQVAALTTRFNEALARRAERWGVEVVDLYGPSREEVPRRPELIAADGYHPSDAGHARWAELVWRGVERRLARR
jgi:lysophospholipase L1-like esterase